MSRAFDHASARDRVAAMLGAALALFLPPLLTTTSDAAASVALAVVTLALAALVRLAVRSVPLAAGTDSAVRSTDDDAAPALFTRVTDPAHHPLRPRAPGLT